MPWRKLAIGNAHVQRFKTQYGKSLIEMSHEKPTVAVFLRQFNCTFCRETLHDIAANRMVIESQGNQLCLVNLSPELRAEEILKQYNLQDLPFISSPDGELYQAFDLEQGNAWQLFGPKVLWRFLTVGVIGGLGLGRTVEGDATQMPGVFLLHRGEILKAFKHKTAADRPDYLDMICPDGCAQPVYVTR